MLTITRNLNPAIRRLVSRVRSNITFIVRGASRGAYNSIRNSNPVITGYSRGNWRVTLGTLPNNEIFFGTRDPNTSYPNPSRFAASRFTIENLFESGGVIISNPVNYINFVNDDSLFVQRAVFPFGFTPNF